MNEILSGKNAFYNLPNYESETKKELASSQPLKPIYTYNTENKVWRVAKDIFSLIIFPIGIYKAIHSLVGKIIVPSSTPVFLNHPSDYADQTRKEIDLGEEWKVKRISVKVDGYTIDAAILGKPSTLGNGRWMLKSIGNGELYERSLCLSLARIETENILSGLNSNAIVFNYPGVGSSTGKPNRNAMVKAYRAMLNFLEDQEKGFGAKEIIGYGHSIGAAVQGEALLSHELKQDVKYVFVKSRTFSDLSTTASLFTNRILGFFVKIFGWNMGSVESSKNLKCPEIIMQTANVHAHTDISGQPEKIKHDGVIAAEASLAKKLLEDKNPKFPEIKYFMGISEGHNYGLNDHTHLVNKINEMLNLQK